MPVRAWLLAPLNLMEEFLIKWTYHNVMEVRPDLDKTQCMIVLGFVAASHDPEVGVNLRVVFEASKYIYPLKTINIH